MNSIEENNSPEWKWLNTSLNNNLEQERKRRELEEARGDIPSPLWEFMLAHPELTWDDIMGIIADVYLDIQRTSENDKRTLGSLHASRPWDDKKWICTHWSLPIEGIKRMSAESHRGHIQHKRDIRGLLAMHCVWTRFQEGTGFACIAGIRKTKH